MKLDCNCDMPHLSKKGFGARYFQETLNMENEVGTEMWVKRASSTNYASTPATERHGAR